MLRKPMRCGCACMLVVSAFLSTSCGGPKETSNSTGMSAAQANAFAESISLAATSSMSSSAIKAAAALSDAILPTKVQEADPLADAILPKEVQPRASILINQPISASRLCTAGGRISVSGNISGTINDTGTGLILISATETVTDWGCLPPLIINGDPYISLSGQFSYFNGVPSTQQHLTINGGVKWGGTAEESCQIHLDTNFNRNGGGRTTGSVCNYVIDITF
jgi:hypothetical protein